MSIETEPKLIYKVTSQERSKDFVPSHHVQTGSSLNFRNPWESYKTYPRWELFKTRFFTQKNFIPVPSQDQLVPVHKPDFYTLAGNVDDFKILWLGHASFFIETPHIPSQSHGIRILIDPVWSERVSPFSFIGPKRFTPAPCKLEDLPDIDIVAISHNHYDHCDITTLQRLYAIRGDRLHFLVPLGCAVWFHANIGPRANVIETDWWDEVDISIDDVDTGIKLACTPSQHEGNRSYNDKGQTLWCSWIIRSISSNSASTKTIFHAGDTAYRYVPQNIAELGPEAIDELDKLPHCPAFSEVGEKYGPIDMSLIPIGCYLPRAALSNVHCAPEDSVCIHLDLKSKKTIGMHWGTFRGGISQYFEDVTEPPKRFRRAAEIKGLKWKDDVDVVDIGELVKV